MRVSTFHILFAVGSGAAALEGRAVEGRVNASNYVNSTEYHAASPNASVPLMVARVAPLNTTLGTFSIVSDNSTVRALLKMAKESCNVSTPTANGTAIQALNGTLVDSHVIQYYRFEKARAALAFSASYNVNSSSAGGREFKNLIDTGLLVCLNETIGHATLHGVSPPQVNTVTVVANVCYGFTCSKTYQIILAVVISVIGVIFLFIGWKMCMSRLLRSRTRR